MGRRRTIVWQSYIFPHRKNYQIFHYSFLAEDESIEKRDQVREYLFDNHYQIDQVTMDCFNYEWNELLARCSDKYKFKTATKLKESYLAKTVSSIDVASCLSNMLFDGDIK